MAGPNKSSVVLSVELVRNRTAFTGSQFFTMKLVQSNGAVTGVHDTASMLILCI
jgi:hypothetical protein